MPKKISVANLIMLAGGVVTLLFSFFDFFGADSDFADVGFSAWSTDAFAFVSTIPAILAIVMIAWVVCELVGVKLPDNVLTFNNAQMKATWGITAAAVMLAFLTVDLGVYDKQFGFFLMLIGSLAMAAGAVMALLGKGTEMVNIGGGSAGAAAGGAPPPPPPYMGGGAPPPPPPPSA